MRHPLIRQGEGPAAAHERILRERAEHRRVLDRNARDAPALNASRPSQATAGGDSRKLRGIPAIGRSVSGAIPGTDPEQVCRRPHRLAIIGGE